RLRRWLAGGVAALMLASQLDQLALFADQLAYNTRDILAQHVALARWMRDHLPAGTRVGLNDAGTIPLVSGLPALDLIGLTSNHPWALAYREGPGSLYEAIERLPPARRPDVLAIYPSWIGLPDLYGEKLHEVKIEDNLTAAEATKTLFRFRLDVLG